MRYFRKYMHGDKIRFVVEMLQLQQGKNELSSDSVFRLAPAQRFCQMPSRCRWHLIPSGIQRSGNYLHFRFTRFRPALLALVPFPFPVAGHTFVTGSADWWA